MPPDNQLLSDSAFLALRFATSIILLSILFLTVRRAILVFVGERSRHLGRKKYIFMAGCALLAGFCLVLQEPVTKMLEALGGIVGRNVPVLTDVWVSGFLVGLFYTFISLLSLLLLIQIVGILYWFFEGRMTAHAAGLGLARITGRTASALVLKAFSYVNRAFRAIALTLLISAFVPLFSTTCA